MRDESDTPPPRPAPQRSQILRATFPIAFGAVGMVFYVVAVGGILLGTLGRRIFGVSPLDIMIAAAVLPALGAIPARNAAAWLALASGVVWLGSWWWLGASGELAPGSTALWLPLSIFYVAPFVAAVLAIAAGALRLRKR